MSVVFLIQQVDIHIIIDDDQSFSRLTPGNVADAAVVKEVHLMISLDALVVCIIGIEVIRRKDIQNIAGILYFSNVTISHVGIPFAYFRSMDSDAKYPRDKSCQ